LHRETKPLVAGEYSNGKTQSKTIDDDDYDPYADDLDINTEEKPSAAALQVEAASGEAAREDEDMEDDEEEGEEEEDEDDEDDGLDIVVTAPQRSMDFRYVSRY
jgi:pre-mRNA 3'-end-processing factor FIP1